MPDAIRADATRVAATRVAAIHAAADLLADADALLIGAGAGIGVDSGLPDFRGADGFWRAYPALAQRGLRFEQIASPRTFDTDPALAWGFYGHRLALYRATEPHAGFGILRRLGQRMPQGCGVFTSNVDGQFQRAGFGADVPVTECHGSIHHLQCSRACSPHIRPADGFEPLVDVASCRLLNEPPHCPHCGALARPNVLMFGDAVWDDARSAQQERALEQWLDSTRRLAIVEVGAGTAIASVRAFGHRLLTARGAVLIRINPREPAVPRRQDVSIDLPALAALTAIEQAIA